MFRVVITKYVPDIGVIYLDSMMRAFGTIESAQRTANEFIESTIKSLQEIYKDMDFTFEAYYPNDPEQHYAIIKQVAHNEDGSVKKELALQIIDIFEVEEFDIFKTENSNKGFKYRDNFIILPVTTDDDANFEYYEISLNGNPITFKEDISEALCFIDNFIHSHIICEAINKDMDITLMG